MVLEQPLINDSHSVNVSEVNNDADDIIQAEGDGLIQGSINGNGENYMDLANVFRTYRLMDWGELVRMRVGTSCQPFSEMGNL